MQGALKKRTDYHDSFSASGVTTLTCANKGCAFSGHISVDFLWKVVQTDNNLGLKCRWAFLGMWPVIKGGSCKQKQYDQTGTDIGRSQEPYQTRSRDWATIPCMSTLFVLR